MLILTKLTNLNLSERRYNNFDLLRLIAAVFVLISHSYEYLGRESEQFKIVYGKQGIILSTLGLCVFFSISGYLVTQSLLRSDSVFDYLRKRFLRIFPGMFVLCVVTIIAFSFATELSAKEYFSNRLTWTYLVVNASLFRSQFALPGTPNINGSIWTIPLEVKLYLTLLIIYFIPRLGTRIMSTIGLVLFFAAYVYLVNDSGSQKIFKEVFPFFTLGCFFVTGSWIALNKEILEYSLFLLAIFLLLSFLMRNSAAYMVFNTMTFSLLIIMLGETRAVLSFRGIDVSYGLYLYAGVVQQLLIYWGGNTMNVYVHMVVSLLISVFLGYLSWTYIEKRFLSRGKKHREW